MTRHQLSRRKDAQLPEGVVNVARPTMWGNPFPIEPEAEGGRAAAVAAFRWWLTEDLEVHELRVFPERRAKILDRLRELRGRDLACWCPLDAECHADVLAELANKAEP